jgi:hypothetical protein
MKRKNVAYVVYNPPAKGLPFLAVILAADGTVIARAFDTEEEAAAFNRQMARSQFTGNDTLRTDGVRHRACVPGDPVCDTPHGPSRIW